ncbi:protein FAM114A2-like isoform X2 [Oculina patagonica]
MDKNSRNKALEGGSSDEEEAFESADEGDEGTKSVKKSSATSADIGSANSTLKELVGKNDASTRSQVASAEEIKTGTTEEGKQNIKMDSDIAQEENNVETLAEEDPVCDERSPSSEESGQQGIESSKTELVEEGTDKLNIDTPKLIEDGADATESARDIDEEGHTEAIKEEIDVEQDQSSENENELMAEENTVKAEDDGQNEASENLDKAQQKSASESICDDKAKDTRDSSAEKPAQEPSSSSGGWGWGGWSSMLSQATASVTSGLSSVIETVETSLGVPDPEEVARKVKAEEKLVKEKQAEAKTEETPVEKKGENESEAAGDSFFTGFGVTSLTSVVQSTGKGLVSGGLDALELIGKKTMNVLAEGDPGLRHKREQLAGKGPSLSQILKEAKEVTEQKAAPAEGTTPTTDLFSEFDKFQGLAHLEALEMLSRDSEAKLESRIIDLTEDELNGVKPLLRAVEEVFHIDENDADDDVTEGGDFKSEVEENVQSLNLPFTADKIVSSQEKAREWIATCVKEQDDSPGSKDGVEIYTTAVSSMAELTARAVELFHKFTELLLHQAEQAAETSSLVRAQCVRKMTDAVLEEISVLATHFAGCLNTAADDSDNPDSVSSLITTLYLDSSTSADYLRNSLKLLRPVLQLSSLDEKNASKS